MPAFNENVDDAREGAADEKNRTSRIRCDGAFEDGNHCAEPVSRQRSN